MRKTNKDLILEYLAAHGPVKAKRLVADLDGKRQTLSKDLTDLVRMGQVERSGSNRFEYLYTITNLTNPQPIGKKNPVKKNVRRDAKVPTWNPGIEYGPDGGELRTPAKLVRDASLAVLPDEQEIFDHFDLSAETWKITNMRRSKWQSFNGDWLEAYRASFAPRNANTVAPLTEDEITTLLNAYTASGPSDGKKFDDSVRLVAIGDTQLGKPDGGGTEATIARFQRIIEDVRADLEWRGGVQALILPWLGDCLEGVVSQGGRNVARLDISVTEQVRVYRRLFLHQIATLAPWANRVLVPVVGGNHDEAFRDQTQSPNDSWAIEGASAVADALTLADKFEHVDFMFPEPERWGVTVNVASEDSPYTIHFEHGHKARNQTKVIDWWKGQTHGRQPAGAADMLITAHWHNFQVQSTGGDRWWFQLPAMDGGSDWFRDKSGEDSTAGVLAMDIVGGQAGWSNLKIHH